MNQPIRRLSLVVALLFSTLLISTTWIQFVSAKQIDALPGNRRSTVAILVS
jgi:peptidoglycan glycosyltransferase